jgi:hypothetical protein
MNRGQTRILPRPLALACMVGFAATALALSVGSARSDDPNTLEEPAKQPHCCGVPPRDEVTADQVFGRWVVHKSGIGAPLKPGDRVEFRSDGTFNTAAGACRFAVLRAELTVTCADKQRSGEVKFTDDSKLIWRHDGKEMMFIAPTD